MPSQDESRGPLVEQANAFCWELVIVRFAEKSGWVEGVITGYSGAVRKTSSDLLSIANQSMKKHSGGGGVHSAPPTLLSSPFLSLLDGDGGLVEMGWRMPGGGVAGDI